MAYKSKYTQRDCTLAIGQYCDTGVASPGWESNRKITGVLEGAVLRLDLKDKRSYTVPIYRIVSIPFIDAFKQKAIYKLLV